MIALGQSPATPEKDLLRPLGTSARRRRTDPTRKRQHQRSAGGWGAGGLCCLGEWSFSGFPVRCWLGFRCRGLCVLWDEWVGLWGVLSVV